MRTPRVEVSAKMSCAMRSEEHTSELQSRQYLVCRLLLEKKQPWPSRASGGGGSATLCARRNTPAPRGSWPHRHVDSRQNQAPRRGDCPGVFFFFLIIGRPPRPPLFPYAPPFR